MSSDDESFTTARETHDTASSDDESFASARETHDTISSDVESIKSTPETHNMRPPDNPEIEMWKSNLLAEDDGPTQQQHTRYRRAPGVLLDAV